jgi:hypothetical protein
MVSQGKVIKKCLDRRADASVEKMCTTRWEGEIEIKVEKDISYYWARLPWCAKEAKQVCSKLFLLLLLLIVSSRSPCCQGLSVC